MEPGFVYILTNKPGGTLYIGVTNDLAKRLMQHRSREMAGFTKRYNLERLVWYERFDNIHDARLVERRMKAWRREWKIGRIEEHNPEWHDLAETLGS